MDIMMPEMGGQTAVREIRALEESGSTLSTDGVKIMMTSAFDDVKNVVQPFKSLCDAYIFNPHRCVEVGAVPQGVAPHLVS